MFYISDFHNQAKVKLNLFLVLQRKDDGKLTFSNLPDDCKRQIITTLPDHADIIHLGQADTSSYNFANDNQLWKEMCFFHFSNRQVLTFHTQSVEESQVDWKYVYKRCYL